MPFYSEGLVEEVRSKNDIVDVISGYVRLKKKGTDYFGLCPFHNEKTPSFSVAPGKQIYYCFGCGSGGNVLSFLMKYENFTFSEAMESLAERAGIQLPVQENSSKMKQEAEKKQILLAIQKEAAKYYYMLLRSENGRRAMDYFKKRKLTEDTMRRFGLGCSDKFGNGLYRYLKKKGYSDGLLKESGLILYDEQKGGCDRFWNRAMFPIMNVHNKVIGFGGRVMGDGEPKYLNSPETQIFDKSRNLYGLNFARTAKKPQILLCEGYMDVIALHQAGFDNAAASLGTSFTSGHANLLKRYAKEAYLAYDSDKAGVLAALRAVSILNEAGIAAKVIDMSPYKDPDEFIKAEGRGEYQKRIDGAENGFLFEIRMLEREYEITDPQGKTAFYNEMAKRLLRFTQELERDNYIEALAKKYQIHFSDLKKLVLSRGAMEGVAAPIRAVKSGIHEKKKKEDGIKQSQSLLLTWLAEDAGLFSVVREHISPEDFTEGNYRLAALALYEQIQETGAANPAKIISMFVQEEDQREVAAAFCAHLKDARMEAGREKALKEILVRIKQNGINCRSNHLDPADILALQQLILDKRQLEELENLHISIE